MIAKKQSPTAAPQPDPLFTASDIARGLGHTPLRHGHDYECWICALAGVIDDGVTSGAIFKEKCR